LVSCYLLSSLAFAEKTATEAIGTEVLGTKALGIEALNNKAIVTEVDNSQATPLKSSGALASTDKNSASPSPEVGKHVMANMNPGSMILSLLMVLALIIICAFVLKRFNLTQQTVSQMKVVTSLSLGTKERLIVVQVADQQLLLGVTAQQITLLEKLDEPLAEQQSTSVAMPKNLLSFLASKKL
jgi:flagellar protein FliO/FliZ